MGHKFKARETIHLANPQADVLLFFSGKHFWVTKKMQYVLMCGRWTIHDVYVYLYTHEGKTSYELSWKVKVMIYNIVYSTRD